MNRRAGLLGQGTPTGWWTLGGTWAILLAYAVVSGGLEQFLRSAAAFLTGRLADARAGSDAFAALFPTAAAATVVMVPLGLGLFALVNAVHGAPPPGPIDKRPTWLRRPRGDYFAVTALVFIEELYARGLFLSLLPRIPLLDGPIAFYVLFLLGNLSWALVHLLNFTDPNDRTILRVLPQFITGILITVVFLDFGLLGALLVHLAYDMILFCLDRWEQVSIVTGIVCGCYLAIGGVAWWSLDRPVSDLLRWLHVGDSFALPGWQPNDYIWAVVLTWAVLTLAAELLLYDSSRGGGHPILAFPTAVVRTLAGLLLFWAFGLVVEAAGPRVVMAAIVLVMVSALSSTGSGLARIFWIRTPVFAVALCAILAIPFWNGVVLLLLLGTFTSLEDIPR